MFPARIGPAGADVARLLGALLGALLGDGDALPITVATRGRGEGGREGGKKGEGGPATGMLHSGTGQGGRNAGLPGETDAVVQRWKGSEELPGASRQSRGWGCETPELGWGQSCSEPQRGAHIKNLPSGRLKDVRSGSVAAEVPGAPAAGQGMEQDLCLLQGEIGRNISWCLGRLEGAVSSL